jgi:hypothetical protein
MKMNKKEQKYVGIAAIVLILVVAANQMGYIALFPKIPGLSQTGNNNGPPITDQSKEDYAKGIGKYELDCKAFDSADPGTARTVGTNVDIFWYHFVGGHWTPDGGAYNPAVTNYYTAKPEDNGYAWIAVKAKTSQAFYIDYQKIKDSDSYIVGYQYTDVDLDGSREFVFQYNLKSHQLPNSGYPVLSWYAYAITYDPSWTGVSTVTNVTSVGNTTTTKYAEWYLSYSAEKKGVGIYKIELKVHDINGTDETVCRMKSMLIPGLGNLDVSQFTKSFTTDDIRYTLNLATSFDGALYKIRMPMSANKDYMTTTLEFTLNDHHVETTLTVYYLVAPTEAGSSSSNAVLWTD